MKIMLVNNTNVDLPEFIRGAVLAAIRAGTTELPAEIDDLFTLRIVIDTPEERRGCLDVK